ncbi:MAG: hypothetical protein KF866_09310 [Phycisphaeraceae bacterium]|nr:hypothetical protein [Phycisphaeraceae bacterium]MCW5754696.1 hypothetical protein [Phycisphaeraceae bacterium]
MRTRRRLVCASVGLILAVVAGCASGPKINPGGVYAGPSVSIDGSRRVHHLIMQAPTPGWQIAIDRTVEHEGRQRVFATIRRPNPMNVYAQVVVPQQVATSIPSTQPLEAFVRVLDFDARDGEYVPLSGTSDR